MDTTAQRPVAVIGFSSAPSPLEPVWPSTHRALLPIAGKPMIVHLIDQLARDGITHIRIAGSIQQFAVRQRLGDGSEWGVRIRYSDLHGADLRAQTVLEFGECLSFSGDSLNAASFERLEAHGPVKLEDPTRREEFGSFWKLWPVGPARYSIACATGKPYLFDPLMTVLGFHTANIEAANGLLDELILPGRRRADGVVVDWGTSISRSARIGRSVVIGKHCSIESSAVLQSDCVVGNGSIIRKGVHLQNVTVLPNTIVGANVMLRDAVVTPVGVFSLEGEFFDLQRSGRIGRARGNEEDRTGIPSEALSVIESTAGPAKSRYREIGNAAQA